jgi:nitrogen regulatory protein P-II 1
MKKIEAIIPTSRVAAVQDALERRDVGEFTLLEVWVTDAEPGGTVLHRGTTYAVDLFPRAKLEMVCNDQFAVPVAYAITDAARVGCAGDGGVLILSVDDGSSHEGLACRHAALLVRVTP